MNLLHLSSGHMDILHTIIRRELQRLAAADTKEGELVNYDQAAHVLTIYDRISTICAKWNGKLPQNPQPHDRYSEITKGSRLYLAQDGTLKKVPPVD